MPPRKIPRIGIISAIISSSDFLGSFELMSQPLSEIIAEQRESRTLVQFEHALISRVDIRVDERGAHGPRPLLAALLQGPGDAQPHILRMHPKPGDVRADLLILFIAMQDVHPDNLATMQRNSAERIGWILRFTGLPNPLLKECLGAAG